MRRQLCAHFRTQSAVPFEQALETSGSTSEQAGCEPREVAASPSACFGAGVAAGVAAAVSSGDVVAALGLAVAAVAAGDGFARLFVLSLSSPCLPLLLLPLLLLAPSALAYLPQLLAFACGDAAGAAGAGR